MYLGTVFQTVLSLLYIIPRLRHGLLSLHLLLVDFRYDYLKQTKVISYFLFPISYYLR